jgi:hypothetical protein
MLSDIVTYLVMVLIVLEKNNSSNNKLKNVPIKIESHDENTNTNRVKMFSIN